MATHFQDYKSVEGVVTACGRPFTDGERRPRGVAITVATNEVSCQRCLGSDRYRLAVARVPRALDDPRGVRRSHG